jgi:O-antigen/teichoic acid export membrane protein
VAQSAAPGDPLEVLAAQNAGHVAIRGAMIRLAGYGVGTFLGTATSILLLRYLGVRDFGLYATVAAIAGIVSTLSDLGISAVAQRDYVVFPRPEQRRDLLANVVGIRLLVTLVAAVLALGFTLIAGYSSVVAAGVGFGVITAMLGVLSGTLLIPPTAALRFGTVASAVFAGDVSGAVAVVVLVVAGAGLMAFLAVPTLAALAVLAVTIFAVGVGRLRPRFNRREWRHIVAQALPLSLADVIGVLYLRALLIVTSLTASAASTGLYAMSNRIVQVLVAGGSVMISASFPIVARAGGTADEERLVHAQQKLFDIAVFAAILAVLVFGIAARPIVVLLGGLAYAGSAPLLRIQSFALVGSFLGMVWLPALIAIRRQRALIAANLLGLAMIVVAGSILIPAFGVTGTAFTAVLGEAAIAATALFFLVRARPELRPRLTAAAKLVAAGAACATFALVPGLPQAAAATFAATGYVVVAWLAGAVPRDPVDALLALRRPGA